MRSFIGGHQQHSTLRFSTKLEAAELDKGTIQLDNTIAIFPHASAFTKPPSSSNNRTTSPTPMTSTNSLLKLSTCTRCKTSPLHSFVPHVPQASATSKIL